MNKKVIRLTLSAMLFALSFPADAQQPAKVPRIGYVSGSGDPKTPGLLVEGFRQGLRDLGYIEGKNILVEYRYTIEAGLDRSPASSRNWFDSRSMCLSLHLHNQSAQPSRRPRRFPSS